jgi:hypothetical protein
MKRFIRAAVVLGVLGAAVVGLTTVAVAGSSVNSELAKVRAATAKYHSLARAQADGYSVENEPCVVSPDGTMGIHAVNGPLIGDPAIDPLRPELLLYAPGPNGKLRLVGVEYFKVDADQNLGTSGDKPSLFGRPFDGPMLGHTPTMPIHYDLHVWVAEASPSGVFAVFNSNPAISC